MRQPLDVLAQQVVAACADTEWEVDRLFDLVRRTSAYRHLTREDFDAVLRMEAERLPTEPRGTSPRLHWDTIRGRIRGRRGARLAVVTSGGTIPDTTDYDVVLEPEGIVLGQVNEDFAQESMRGDIFTLGNAAWRILRIQRGRMIVESAAGLPPTIPFWHGEAPGRTAELSSAVARLRIDLAERLGDADAAAGWLAAEAALGPDAARQAVDYVARQQAAVGVVPTDTCLLAERFFDSLGGTQVVLHAPFGMRVNRAWGLALSKRVCRTFNFEIQSSATDDAVLLAFGPRHSFPLESIWSYLHPNTLRDTLVQAILQAPLFETRFRQAAARALLILRHAGGRRVPAYLQKLRATDLLAACFPEQQACLDNRPAEIDVPVSDHPLVRETLRECLEDALDLRRLVAVLEGIRLGTIRTETREVPAPSPFAHQILAAWDYSFIDDAPREERRSRTVQSHRGLLDEVASGDRLAGVLDPAVISQVAEEVGGRAPGSQARDADELCEALKDTGPQAEAELGFRVEGPLAPLLERLVAEGRVVRADRGSGPAVWVAVETLPLCRAAYPGLVEAPPVVLPAALAAERWELDVARRELARRRLRHAGPVGVADLAAALALPPDAVVAALAGLEAEGVVFRGRYDPRGPVEQWCERTVLERIHRRTLAQLRAEIQPVGPAEFTDFLCRWQRVGPDARLHGIAGLQEVLAQLQGVERPALAWERDVLAVRLADYRPELLDQLTLSGTFLWGRVAAGGAAAEGDDARPGGPPPIAFLGRGDVGWLRHPADATAPPAEPLGGAARAALAALESRGALFVDELARVLEAGAGGPAGRAVGAGPRRSRHQRRVPGGPAPRLARRPPGAARGAGGRGAAHALGAPAPRDPPDPAGTLVAAAGRRGGRGGAGRGLGRPPARPLRHRLPRAGPLRGRGAALAGARGRVPAAGVRGDGPARPLRAAGRRRAVRPAGGGRPSPRGAPPARLAAAGPLGGRSGARRRHVPDRAAPRAAARAPRRPPRRPAAPRPGRDPPVDRARPRRRPRPRGAGRAGRRAARPPPRRRGDRGRARARLALARRPRGRRLPRRRRPADLRRLPGAAPPPPPGDLSASRTTGLLLIALAAVSWGTTGATMTLVARDSAMSPLLVGFFRVAIAAPCLLLAARAVGGPLRLPAGGERGRLVAGGVAMGAYQVCYFWGVAKTSVAVGSLIAICSAPLFMIGLAALWLGERVSRTTGAALVAGVTGAALLTVGPHGVGALPAGFLGGVALALGAGLAYAVYAVVVKDVVARLPPLPIAAVTFGVAALVLLPALATERATAGPATWALLAYLGVVPTALAYVAYVVGMRTTPVAVSGILTLIEPLTATLLGVIFFGDRLGATGAVGASSSWRPSLTSLSTPAPGGRRMNAASITRTASSGPAWRLASRGTTALPRAHQGVASRFAPLDRRPGGGPEDPGDQCRLPG